MKRMNSKVDRAELTLLLSVLADLKKYPVLYKKMKREVVQLYEEAQRPSGDS